MMKNVLLKMKLFVAMEFIVAIVCTMAPVLWLNSFNNAWWVQAIVGMLCFALTSAPLLVAAAQLWVKLKGYNLNYAMVGNIWQDLWMWPHKLVFYVLLGHVLSKEVNRYIARSRTLEEKQAKDILLSLYSRTYGFDHSLSSYIKDEELCSTATKLKMKDILISHDRSMSFLCHLCLDHPEMVKAVWLDFADVGLLGKSLPRDIGHPVWQHFLAFQDNRLNRQDIFHIDAFIPEAAKKDACLINMTAYSEQLFKTIIVHDEGLVPQFIELMQAISAWKFTNFDAQQPSGKEIYSNISEWLHKFHSRNRLDSLLPPAKTNVKKMNKL